MSEPRSRTQADDDRVNPNNILQQTLFGIPVYLWLIGVGILIILLIYYRRKNQSTTDVTSSTDTTSAGTVPPFINQVYVNDQPPTQEAREGPGFLENIIDKQSKVIKTTSAHTFRDLAKIHHMTVNQFEVLNPNLAKSYLNTGRKVPKGTQIRIYSGQTVT